MTNRKLGVGVIGVQPGRSWAAIAHIPALRALEEYEVVALSTTRAESARAAAEAFSVARWYDNYAGLIADPAVDVVAVTVKVPHHLELTRAAIAAGKHVYCEWPLGNGLAEAEEMAALARKAGVRAAVGLQARAAPVINYVRDLVREGYVGEVLSTTLIGSGMNWGAVIDQPNAYTADRRNGATLLTIPFGHTVDALCHCLGEFQDVHALMVRRRTSFTLVETGDSYPMTAEDQVAVAGRLANGTVAAIHYRGGASRGTNLLWEINGSAGDLQVTSIGGHAQIFDLALQGASGLDQALKPMSVPAAYLLAPEGALGPAANVAIAYQRFAADIRDGGRSCPDFEDAVAMHRLLAAIEESAAAGKKVMLR